MSTRLLGMARKITVYFRHVTVNPLINTKNNWVQDTHTINQKVASLSAHKGVDSKQLAL